MCEYCGDESDASESERETLSHAADAEADAVETSCTQLANIASDSASNDNSDG